MLRKSIIFRISTCKFWWTQVWACAGWSVGGLGVSLDKSLIVKESGGPLFWEEVTNSWKRHHLFLKLQSVLTCRSLCCRSTLFLQATAGSGIFCWKGVFRSILLCLIFHRTSVLPNKTPSSVQATTCKTGRWYNCKDPPQTQVRPLCSRSELRCPVSQAEPWSCWMAKQGWNLLLLCVKISAARGTADVLTSAWLSCAFQLSKNLLFGTEVIDTITVPYKILLKWKMS